MMMRIIHDLFDPKVNIMKIGVLLLLLFFSVGIVYFTGGTEFAFTHFMYLPIILSAYYLGMRGAVATALLGGLMMGPLMPLNVSNGTRQAPDSWILRMAIFAVIGLVVGSLFKRIGQDKEVLVRKSFCNNITGLPNAYKLRIDLDKLIQGQKGFSLIIFRITNLNQINIYVDYTVGDKSLLITLNKLGETFGGNPIYSVSVNEFAVVMQGKSVEEAYIKAKKLLKQFHEPISLDGLPVNIVMKCGIINYPLHGQEVNDLIKKMERTLDQEKLGDHKIAIYEESLSQQNKIKYNTVISLYEAIRSDQFSLAYQPIINIKRQEITGAEALLRWSNSKNLHPGEFIKIAEDAGIISEITKWVMTKAMDQIKEWQAEGIHIRIAVNLSSGDLKKRSIFEYAADYMESHKIDPSSLVLELTERVLIENESEAEGLLNRIKAIGINTSIDDFGTGYNSLIQLVKLPIDYLKIDKFFIDHIENIHHRTVIKESIRLAHSLGMEVIAEGVETKKQLEFLESMGCDNIQGYYFSKPLPSEEFAAFFHGFGGAASEAPDGMLDPC